MLCELSLSGNFLTTWIATSVLGAVSILISSGIVFHKFYVNPTYEQWRWKSNPKYPSATKVRDEIIQMMKGVATATLCPSMALYLGNNGMSQAYCGVGEYGWSYLILSFFVLWIASDFCEFYYHRMGHIYASFWSQHKYHHVFFNPTPFAVIADEYVDQFARSSPLLVFPLIMPVNMDMMFFEYALFFYAYGVYLHWGYEVNYPDAHHPWINTAFQHYCHHAKSIMNKPYHTGFFFKAWDQMFGSVYDGDCFCAKCSCAKGERERDAWEKIEIPDYSVLLKPAIWIDGLFGEGTKSRTSTKVE